MEALNFTHAWPWPSYLCLIQLETHSQELPKPMNIKFSEASIESFQMVDFRVGVAQCIGDSKNITGGCILQLETQSLRIHIATLILDSQAESSDSTKTAQCVVVAVPVRYKAYI